MKGKQKYICQRAVNTRAGSLKRASTIFCHCSKLHEQTDWTGFNPRHQPPLTHPLIHKQAITRKHICMNASVQTHTCSKPTHDHIFSHLSKHLPLFLSHRHKCTQKASPLLPCGFSLSLRDMVLVSLDIHCFQFHTKQGWVQIEGSFSLLLHYSWCCRLQWTQRLK